MADSTDEAERNVWDRETGEHGVSREAGRRAAGGGEKYAHDRMVAGIGEVMGSGQRAAGSGQWGNGGWTVG